MLTLWLFFSYLCFGSFMLAVCFPVRNFPQELGSSWHTAEGNVNFLIRTINVLGQSLLARAPLSRRRAPTWQLHHLPPCLCRPQGPDVCVCRCLPLGWSFCFWRSFLLPGGSGWAGHGWSWSPCPSCQLLLLPTFSVVPLHCPQPSLSTVESWASLAHCPQRAVIPESFARCQIVERAAAWRHGVTATPRMHFQLVPLFLLLPLQLQSFLVTPALEALLGSAITSNESNVPH